MLVRRSFSIGLFMVIALCGQPVVATKLRDSSEAAKSLPNIVLIISDDHGWTDYSFMGHPHIRTPNIDRLATESLVFTRGYVPSSLCCPSLATIITGLYPHQHKITSNDPPMPAGMVGRAFYDTPEYRAGRETMNRQLEAVPTLPRMLAEAGYVSLQTGKWWQGNYRRGGFTHGMTHGDRHGDEGVQVGRRTMQPIFDFIDEARRNSQPFFIWYAPMMPHQAHNPPPRFLKNYERVAPSPHVARYWGMVEWFDHTVGQLVRYLDEQGLAEDTIIVYVADNGWITDPETGEYASKSKQSQYDGGLRTPIIVRWPSRIEPRRSDSIVSSIDIAPTLLVAAKLRPTAEMPGVNLLDERAVAHRKTIFGECFTHESQAADDPAASLRWRWMIEGDWKLILPSPQNEPHSPIELYNLADDPHEENNLARGNDLRVEELRQNIDAWWNAKGSTANAGN